MEPKEPWSDTRAAARGAFAVVGLVAVVAVLLEQVNLLAERGLGKWAEAGISGADFVLLLVIVPAMLWIGATAALDALAQLRRRRHGS